MSSMKEEQKWKLVATSQDIEYPLTRLHVCAFRQVFERMVETANFSLKGDKVMNALSMLNFICEARQMSQRHESKQGKINRAMMEIKMLTK